MARINQALIERISSQLGVTQSAVYARIAKVAREESFERPIAALVVASRNGINYHKYSTPEQRAQMRNGSNQADTPREASASVDARVTRRRTGKNRQPARRAKDNSVFVVHGRNKKLTSSMYGFLRAIGLKPIEWDMAVLMPKGGGNPYVGEVIDTAMNKGQALVVILSPDDEAKLKDVFLEKGERPEKLQGQPRPNVLLEAGLALAHHSHKTLLVQVGKIRQISDIAGRHMLHLTDDEASRMRMAQRLEKIGCAINLTGAEWRTVGTFVA
jgi:predicted nucleotide-binding protein